MNPVCANCEAPQRALWVLFGTPRKPVVRKVIDGNWISLERCDSCSALWCVSPYEPYASFPYLVAWPRDEESWKQTHDSDCGRTLLSWHAHAIAAAWHSVPPDERDAVEAHRKRSYGHNPIDDPASFEAAPLPS